MYPMPRILTERPTKSKLDTKNAVLKFRSENKPLCGILIKQNGDHIINKRPRENFQRFSLFVYPYFDGKLRIVGFESEAP